MRILLAAFLVSACAGDNAGQPDCKGQSYDPCVEEHDCESAICRPFATDGTLTVCTAMCTPGDASTCPEFKGGDVECTEFGQCKPSGQNSCHLSVIN